MESLLGLPTIVQAIFLFLFGLGGGGGVVYGGLSWYRSYHKQNRKNVENDLDYSSHIEERLKSVENRLYTTEESLNKTRSELNQEKMRNKELMIAIDTLTNRVDQLIDRLESHESITVEEKQRLTSVPFVDKEGQ